MRTRIAGVLAIAVLLALAALQLASAGIFWGAGTPVSLPAHISPAFGERVYGAIERVAPVPFVEAMLTQAALGRGDLLTAALHARRMPLSQARSELEARIARARGDARTAEGEFLAADDVPAVQSEVDRLQSLGETARAYALEHAIRIRLASTATHPDAVAESYWRSGNLATELARRGGPRSASWMQTGLNDYDKALSLAPFSEKFLLAAGTQELNMHNDKAANAYFQRGIEVDPQSADAYAGLGVVALHHGDRGAAERFAHIARAIDAGSKMLALLESALR